MQLGFVSAILEDQSLEEVLRFAAGGRVRLCGGTLFGLRAGRTGSTVA